MFYRRKKSHLRICKEDTKNEENKNIETENENLNAENSEENLKKELEYETAAVQQLKILLEQIKLNPSDNSRLILQYLENNGIDFVKKYLAFFEKGFNLIPANPTLGLQLLKIDQSSKYSYETINKVFDYLTLISKSQDNKYKYITNNLEEKYEHMTNYLNDIFKIVLVLSILIIILITIVIIKSM